MEADDDEEFLYGGSSAPTAVPSKGGFVESHDDDFLDDTAVDETRNSTPSGNQSEVDNGAGEGDDVQEGEGEDEADDESDDDIEIIMNQAPSRSLDLRPQNRQAPRSFSGTIKPPQAVGTPPTKTTNLTTEYTPRDRNAPPQPQQVSTSLPAQVATGAAVAQQQLGFPSEAFASTSQTQYPPPTNQQLAKQENGGSDLPDPSSLPPVRAPSSHPPIEPNIPGTFSDRPIYEVDIQSLADKTWRRPGSNLSDWFNYGFDEISWEAYCVRRRELGTIANELKTSVLNLAALPEDSFQNTVPPEMRSAVIAQAAMMGVPPSAYPQAAHHGYPGGPHGMGMMHHPGMVPPEMMGMNMNMGMGMQQGMQQGMNGMNMGPPGMNVNAMGMSGMESGPGPGMGGGQGPGNGEEGQGDGFNNYNNNMVNDYGNGPGVQVQEQSFDQPNPNQVQNPMIPQGPTGPRGGVAPRGRGAGRGFGGGVPLGVPPTGPAGRGAYAARGRGMGVAQALPARPASPLPPNVPTGPRNLNRYKDKDRDGGNIADGLDYGATGAGAGSPLNRDKELREDSQRRDSPKEREHRDRDRDEKSGKDKDKDKDKDKEKRRREKEKEGSHRDRDREERHKEKEKEKPSDEKHRKRTHSSAELGSERERASKRR